ncbi:unnamed protein product [Staurois parvus]|uniref:Uncharacterized protein n=1 Tax=Staurois parvus TaxID=386267 RepID=A0ABN9AD00_9NEOB|nr:unnamed protein product [Staurois parvus]
MTRDCGQCRSDQRLRTVHEMTRDCGQQCRGDQRLRTVQGMTRDCRQYRG